MYIHNKVVALNINTLKQLIWILILVLCANWFVDPTVGLVQAQEVPSKVTETTTPHDYRHECRESAEDCKRDNDSEKARKIDNYILLLRLVLFPCLLWLLRSLIIYNLERIHTVELLKKDIKSRISSTESAMVYLKAWLDAAKLKPEKLPYLRTESEPHLIFPSVQDSLRQVLWKDEVWTVRSFYRYFHEIEIRAANIARLYAHYMEEICAKKKSWYISAISDNYKYIDVILQAYIDANAEMQQNPSNTANKEIINEKFFFSKWIYLPLFVLPFSLILIISWTIEELLKKFLVESVIVDPAIYCVLLIWILLIFLYMFLHIYKFKTEGCINNSLNKRWVYFALFLFPIFLSFPIEGFFTGTAETLTYALSILLIMSVMTYAGYIYFGNYANMQINCFHTKVEDLIKTKKNDEINELKSLATPTPTPDLFLKKFRSLVRQIMQGL